MLTSYRVHGGADGLVVTGLDVLLLVVGGVDLDDVSVR